MDNWPITKGARALPLARNLPFSLCLAPRGCCKKRKSDSIARLKLTAVRAIRFTHSLASYRSTAGASSHAAAAQHGPADQSGQTDSAGAGLPVERAAHSAASGKVLRQHGDLQGERGEKKRRRCTLGRVPNMRALAMYVNCPVVNQSLKTQRAALCMYVYAVLPRGSLTPIHAKDVFRFRGSLLFFPALTQFSKSRK